MKEQLQHIFQNGYPGSNGFIEKVLKPMFSEDVITNIDIDIIDSPEKRRRADNANILSATHVADINCVDSDPVALYDVTLKPGSKIEHSRVAIKQFIASEVMTFTHAFILFHYDNEPEHPWRFSYVYKERTTSATRAVAKRYTYVFGKDYRSRTAIERFIALARSPKTDEDFAKAFSVETLSDEFFDRYRELYADFVQYITGKRYVKESGKWVEKKIHNANPQLATSFDGDDKLVRDYIKMMFGRIVFLYFLQRKGWLAGNRQYMHDLFYSSELQDNFLDGVLEPLFFGILNTRPEHRSSDVAALPDSDKIPYLNGGLFQQDEIDERKCVLPTDYFKRLFDFFDQYNFTIDENDPEDAEVGIDPEMLGRIFENLLEDNKDKGAFYTPKEIVEYMCRESIIAYLLNGIPERSHELIRNFVETLDADSLNNEQRKYLAKKLVDVKICDPAIGSGAFPMGIVNILSKIYLALGLVRDRSKMKRHIMEQNIYGVDIEKGAVDIARLRFWLAMVVDATEPEPLPNLHFKIMQGNSLLETYEGFDLTSLVEPLGDRLDFIWSETEAQMLQNRLTAYYGTTDHHDRDRIAREIHDSVMRQLLNAGIAEEKLVGLDPSSTDKFFLWHTWFADVFKNGGFDIVIANPPYIDSETMTQLGQEDLREYISQNFRYISGNWDIYMAFMEKGLSICKGVMCYITPDKWLSKPFGKKFRKECMTKQLVSIVHCGSSIFENATVDAIITLFAQNSDLIQAAVFNKAKTIELRGSIEGSELVNPFLIDSLFSPNASIISYIESHISTHIGDYATCESACSTSDAYKLVPFISESDTKKSYRLVNTGTLDKFGCRWGIKEIVYLKKDLGYCPLKPMVPVEDFETSFGNAYKNKAKGPKIILKGLNLLDAFVDEKGFYLPGKSTLVINSSDKNILFFLSALINSSYASFYIRTKYSSSSYCGGITFTKEMINALPVPELSDSHKERLIVLSKMASKRRKSEPYCDIEDIINEIDMIILKSFNFTFEQTKVINPCTSITREEYENYE